jgi:C-terminal processing protease CtpA/Prc
MKQLLLYFWGGILLLFTAGACHDDDNGDDGIPAETIAINKWVREVMEEVYYWESEIPQVDHTKESDTEAYFYKLLYKDDNWSWITDDYASLAADYSGVPVTMGYDPTFYLASDKKSIFIVVNYVYPNSAAAAAGLKRGDIILSINGTDLNIDNYYDLYSGDSYSVQLGKATLGGNNSITISKTNISYNLTARVTTTDPAIHHEVIDTLGYKIGYLAYVEFVSGDNHVFLNSLDNIFNEFKSAGISDLIVDLRYNPGGDLDAAGHLASEIAPAAHVNAEDIIVKLQYNDLYQDYFESDPKFEDELYYRFSKLNSNINMQKVYFLTTDGTASASEMVITGLDPYMDVVLVGDSTYGKYAGAWLIPDDDKKWAVIPVTMKYANAAGYTDFVDGLIPDEHNLIDDDLIFAVPFGDTADPMIKRAIEDIAGVPPSVATRSRADVYSRFKRLIPENKEMNLRRNLYVPVQRVTSYE